MKGIIDSWKELLAVGTFLVGSAVGFAEVPPQDTVARPLAIFCVAALVSIAYAAMRRWSLARQLPAWCIATVVALLVTLGAHYYYTTLYARHVAVYQGSKYVIGSNLTPIGQSYVAKNPQKTNDELLFDSGGKVATIWTPASVAEAAVKLRYAFLLCSPLVGATIMAAAQVAQLSVKRRRK